MEEKLKPCPFCGGPVELEKTVDRREWWGVVCRNTGNIGGSCALQIRPSGSKEAAVERWNKRAIDPETEKDAAIGRVVWRFIDRMGDVSPPHDSAEKILADFYEAVKPEIDAAADAQRAKS